MTSPIQYPSADDAGGRDIVSGSVAGSVAASIARYTELSSDTYLQGSTLGDVLQLPEVPAYQLPPPPIAGYPWQGDEPVG